MKKLPGAATVLRGLGFYLLLTVLVAPLVLGTIRSNDLWKALYSGRYLATFSRFPHHSTFTFSPVENVQERDAFNWLGNLALYGIHRGAGELGLQILRVSLVILVIALVHSRVGFHRCSVVLLLLVALVYGLHQKLLLRTAIFAIPGMTLLIWIWLRAHCDRDPTILWTLPVLMVLWSNTHGSYLAGLGVLLLLVLGETLDELRTAPVGFPGWIARCFGVLLLSGVLAATVKPFPDTKSWTYFERLETGVISLIGTRYENTKSASSSDPLSIERNPIRPRGSSLYKRLKSLLNNTLFGRDRAFRSAEFAFPLDQPRALFVTVNLGLSAGVLAGMVLVPRRIGFHRALPLVGVLVLGLGYLRTMAYIPLVGIPFFLELFRQELSGDSLSKPVRWVSRGTVGVLLLLAVVQGWGRSNGHFSGVRMHELGIGRAARLSAGVPEFLRGLSGARVFNHYNLGSFLVWQWWPHRKVFIDSKSSAYRADFRRQYARLTPPELVNHHDLDRVVLPISNRWNYRYFIPRPSWSVVAFDGGMIVYWRTARAVDVEPLEVLKMNPGSLGDRSEGIRETLRHLCWFIQSFQNKASFPDSGNKENSP